MGPDVYCQGCQTIVARAEAQFVIWGSAYCHFCNRCLSIIKKAKAEGREATFEELQR